MNTLEISATVERARTLFKENGYNCAQSVVGAFAERLPIDFETAMRLTSSFGGGMGRLREVCGAVSGMFVVAGLLVGPADTSPDAKKKHYALIQHLAAKFREKEGAIRCAELLHLDHSIDPPTPEARTATYYQKRPCAELVMRSTEIVCQEVLAEKYAGA